MDETELMQLVATKPKPEQDEFGGFIRRALGPIDPVRDVPATWVGVEFMRARLAPIAEDLRKHDLTADQLITGWLRRKAEVFLNLPGGHKHSAEEEQLVSAFVDAYRKRIDGFDDTGPCRIYFDELSRRLHIMRADSSTREIRGASATLLPKTYLHEWQSSLACEVVLSEGGPQFDLKTNQEKYASHWNKALDGIDEHLVALGLGKFTSYELPVAYVRDEWSMHPASKCISVVRVARSRLVTESFDVQAYFLGLYREKKLPLASEEDVPRLLMALASPLLRHVAPGLLGCYWLNGAPGSGKDYLASLLCDIWRGTVDGMPNVSFDLSATGDLEQKRSFYAAGPALYARVKEAGKRRNIIDLLIRFTGSAEMSARGMRKDETVIRNSFTYLADSVEDIPNRKEVARRSVMIGVAAVDGLNWGEVRAEILEHAPAIIAGLKAVIESQPASWYLKQADAGPRPVVPVALARLFGGTLPEIGSASTDELRDALVEYISCPEGIEEGKRRQQEARDKDGREARLFRSYRMSHFIDIMKSRPSWRDFFGQQIRTAPGLMNYLCSEFDYAKLPKAMPYLCIDGKQPHVFKVIKAKRQFVFEEEQRYLDVMQTRERAAEDKAEEPRSEHPRDNGWRAPDVREAPAAPANDQRPRLDSNTA